MINQRRKRQTRPVQSKRSATNANWLVIKATPSERLALVLAASQSNQRPSDNRIFQFLVTSQIVLFQNQKRKAATSISAVQLPAPVQSTSLRAFLVSALQIWRDILQVYITSYIVWKVLKGAPILSIYKYLTTGGHNVYYNLPGRQYKDREVTSTGRQSSLQITPVPSCITYKDSLQSIRSSYIVLHHSSAAVASSQEEPTVQGKRSSQGILHLSYDDAIMQHYAPQMSCTMYQPWCYRAMVQLLRTYNLNCTGV